MVTRNLQLELIKLGFGRSRLAPASEMAMGCNCGRLLCFGSVVLMFLLLADIDAAHGDRQQREIAVVGLTRELYLRGNTVTILERVSTEPGEGFESLEEFERRELVDAHYSDDPADPNCDNDPTLCAP